MTARGSEVLEAGAASRAGEPARAGVLFAAGPAAVHAELHEPEG